VYASDSVYAVGGHRQRAARMDPSVLCALTTRARWQWAQNRWQEGDKGVEKASDLRARARRSGSERESYGLIGEGTANEVTVERERIGPTGWTRTCTCGRRPPRERDQRSRRAPASGARPGRWQDEGSSRLHSGLSLQHADPTVEKFRRRAATPITSHCSRCRIDSLIFAMSLTLS